VEIRAFADFDGLKVQHKPEGAIDRGHPRRRQVSGERSEIQTGAVAAETSESMLAPPDIW